jgi:hypothetical protein
MAKFIDGKKYCSCGTEIFTKSNYCSPCAVASNQRWQKKGLEQGLSKSDVYNYRWRESNPKKYLLQNAKSRAKKRGLEFNLTEDDFDIPTHCPVFGFPLELYANKGTKDNKPSLDRIDSSKGYVKGNIQVLSWRANNLKSDGTIEEFIRLVEFMKNGDT